MKLTAETTPQQVFDFVADRLNEQGRPAMHDNHCLYRDPYGAKCALGWLIPDNLYDKSLEELPAWELYGKRLDDCSTDALAAIVELRQNAPWIVMHGNLVSALQKAHDSAARTEVEPWLTVWQREMMHVAKEFGLDTERVKPTGEAS